MKIQRDTLIKQLVEQTKKNLNQVQLLKELDDEKLNLIYIDELINRIITAICEKEKKAELKVGHTAEVNVSSILERLTYFEKCYKKNGEIPILTSSFELNLFNTFRCFIPISDYFPKAFTTNTDTRGNFVEIVRSGISGQTSFSTTKPGVVRGNHFHTRKIERFAVIKGKAQIQLRKVGSEEVYNFELSGDKPAFVDMPIWYTHNITNVGEEELITIFWINEPYNPKDPDTWFEHVE